MRPRLVILTEIISPYRIPLFNALAEDGEVDLHVIFLAETDPVLRQWQVYKEEMHFSYQVLPSWRKWVGRYNMLLNRGVGGALARAAPDVILCGGYNYFASWQSLLWARVHKIPFVLWSESNAMDLRHGHSVVELLKSEFVRQCSGFVVPGQAAQEYLCALKGIKDDVIFTAPNAVDNNLFAAAAAAARQNAATHRQALVLPERYFLFAGRLVREKGVFELLSAYAKLDESIRRRVGLVFVGDGPSRQQLEVQAASLSPGVVRFAGFAQRDQLAIYYALAEMLILPTYTDTWGLVVNEAMACALPVILSRAAGCAVDLLTENWNGLLVPPRDVSSLNLAMRSLADQPDLCAAMGVHSVQRISNTRRKNGPGGLRVWSKPRAQRVTERIPKIVYVAALVLCPLGLIYLAYSQPGYFTSQTYMGGLLLLEFLALAVWLYRRVFFPLVMVAFLLAGVDLPVGAFWTQARWLFLCVGAVAGSVLMLRERSHYFGQFHIVATFAALATLVSAAVSQYPSVALLKSVSFMLLFLYAGTGARLAVTGRENRFFAGLLTGCEVLVGAIAISYALGVEAMGNPNSLGAVMGVVGAPILLWGALLDETPFIRRRRFVLYGVSIYLAFHSQSRAGLASALVSSGILCFALRKYRAVLKGAGILLIMVAAAAIVQPDALSSAVSSLTSAVVYKGGRDASVLASRESPWRSAVDSIRNHFWFGTGIGTTENANDPSEHVAMFSSSTEVSTENGSSYLSIVVGVGVIGALPFTLLLMLLLRKVFRTIAWLVKTRNACHPAVPLAMVLLAGMIHAGFEDWLFAPGYYVCVLFWSLAFILVDVAPSPVASEAFAWRLSAMPRGLGGVASSR